MTGIRQLFTLLLLGACMSTLAQSTTGPSKAPGAATNASFQQKDTAYWIDNFRQFRDAVYQKNIPKTKAFFSFPVAREANEIWYLAYEGNEQQLQALPEAKPFTEKDLEKYYSKLFPKGFINSLLKVKTDILFSKGSFETPAIKDGPTTYILYTTYDKASRMLTLNLFSTTPVDIGNGEKEAAEFSVLYEFRVLPNGHIQFSHVMLAG